MFIDKYQFYRTVENEKTIGTNIFSPEQTPYYDTNAQTDRNTRGFFRAR